MNQDSTLMWDKNYPKDYDLKWFDKTESPKIEISQPAFTYEDMKYNPQAKEKFEFPLDIFNWDDMILTWWENIGEMSEWLKEADCKSVGSAFEGSNPSLPTTSDGPG